MFKDDVTPDDSLLEQIFTANQPRTISVFLQNWDKCVFKAGFQHHRPTCVVRLEAENESPRSFPMVAAMQQIAATITPEIIPRTFRVGKAHNAQGRKFHFSVNEFVEGDVLEDVWHQMSAGEHSAVVAELVEALEKLHSVRLSDKGVKEIVNKTLRENGDEVPESLEQPGVFGGPHTGFVNGGLALLHCIMERRQLKKPFCTVETIVDSPDIKVQSNFQELGLVTLKKSDIDVWPGEAVFCHNDLTPRNIILQKHDPSSGKATRKLAGIIDWELAGFYPASYELSLQDTYLGANRHLSFYVLLK